MDMIFLVVQDTSMNIHHVKLTWKPWKRGNEKHVDVAYIIIFRPTMSTLEYVNCTDPPQFVSTGDPYFPAGLHVIRYISSTLEWFVWKHIYLSYIKRQKSKIGRLYYALCRRKILLSHYRRNDRCKHWLSYRKYGLNGIIRAAWEHHTILYIEVVP